MGQPYSAESAWRRSRTVIPAPVPAAGADWSLVVPSGHLYQLRTILATLTTSAVVANRVPRLVMAFGGVTFVDIPPVAVQAASGVVRYQYLESPPAYVIGGGSLGILPQLDLETGWTVGSLTTALDVGDQWSSIQVGLVDVTVRPGVNDVSGAPDLTVELVGIPSS